MSINPAESVQSMRVTYLPPQQRSIAACTSMPACLRRCRGGTSHTLAYSSMLQLVRHHSSSSSSSFMQIEGVVR